MCLLHPLFSSDLFHILIASFNPWLYLTSFCIYTGHSCITKFDLFRLFCFDKPVLITALSAMNNLREDPIEKGSRALRFPGYKQYTRWVQNYLCVWKKFAKIIFQKAVNTFHSWKVQKMKIVLRMKNNVYDMYTFFLWHT